MFNIKNLFWRDGCINQKIFMVLQAISLILVVSYIIYIWVLVSKQPDNGLINDVIKQLEIKKATALTTYAVCFWVTNFLVQMLILQYYCGKKGNESWGLYLILFLVVFFIINIIVSAIFSPIIAPYMKQN